MTKNCTKIVRLTDKKTDKKRDLTRSLKLTTIRTMSENQSHIPQSDLVPRGRITLDNIPLELAKDSASAFPDGKKGRKHAIITLLALSLDPDLPEEVKRFLTLWGYEAENYPTEINPRGLYKKFLKAIEEAEKE